MEAMKQSVFVILTAFLTAVFGGEYTVIYSPQYVKFRQTSTSLDVNEIDALITSIYGLTASKPLHWDGLLVGSVFRRPKANVLLSVYSTSSISLQSDPQHYFTSNNEHVNTESVVERIEQVFPTGKSLLIDFSTDETVFDVEARNPGVFSSLSATLNDATAKLNANPNALGSVAPLLRTLKVFQEPDLFFFGEILVVREIINQVKVHRHLAVDKYPDFFHFRFLSLSRIVEKYGASSEQFAEAQTVLSAFVKEVASDLRELYTDNVVIELVTVSESVVRFTRKGRSLQQAGSSSDPLATIGLTGKVDEDYSVIFNIILWGMIGLAIAIYFISYGIWNMDPGRDSIIYRMTSQRMKRE